MRMSRESTLTAILFHSARHSLLRQKEAVHSLLNIAIHLQDSTVPDPTDLQSSLKSTIYYSCK